MSRRRKKQPAIDVVDVSEWAELAARLKAYCPQKHDEVLDALRKITEAQQVLSENAASVVPNYERYSA